MSAVAHLPANALARIRSRAWQVLDDFREAYYWLRHNTKPDAKVMSWCVM
jgi:dolichyl-diphosphooligosaccharide--protein glycosyltransferase